MPASEFAYGQSQVINRKQSLESVCRFFDAAAATSVRRSASTCFRRRRRVTSRECFAGCILERSASATRLADVECAQRRRVESSCQFCRSHSAARLLACFALRLAEIDRCTRAVRASLRDAQWSLDQRSRYGVESVPHSSGSWRSARVDDVAPRASAAGRAFIASAPTDEKLVFPSSLPSGVRRRPPTNEIVEARPAARRTVLLRCRHYGDRAFAPGMPRNAWRPSADSGV